MDLNSDYLGPDLFNTPLEAGIRTVFLLEAFAPKAFDITELSLLDYFIVHLRDAGGPESIHPEIFSRSGEYFVRRRLIEQGVALMVRASLVEQVIDKAGLTFRSLETANAFTDLISSDYNTKLLNAAKWLAKQSQDLQSDTFFDDLKDRIDKWSHEALWEPRL